MGRRVKTAMIMVETRGALSCSAVRYPTLWTVQTRATHGSTAIDGEWICSRSNNKDGKESLKKAESKEPWVDGDGSAFWDVRHGGQCYGKAAQQYEC
jgi:hypothetical protein